MSQEKLLIFDCDGVLIDSEIISSRIEAEHLTKLGYPISTEESIRRFTGISVTSVQDIIFREEGLTLPNNFFELTNAAIQKAFETELQPLIKSVLEFFTKEVKVKKCIASSSNRGRIIKALKNTEQNKFFKRQHIFTASQVERGKPAPDLFLFSANRMCCAPENCIVIEDSPSGIQAALTAGLAVVGFMGGKHTQVPGYKERILNFKVPVVSNATELLNYLKKFFEF